MGGPSFCGATGLALLEPHDPAVHYAFYEFSDVAEAEALIGSDKIKPLVADFDRVWGSRTTRGRETLEVVQEITT